MLTAIVAILTLIIVWSLVSGGIPAFIPVVAIAALAVVGFALLRYTVNPDHLRARQSDRTLYLASKTLGYMREGLNEESADAVCRLLLSYSSAIAVSITDTQKVLGFAGIGVESQRPKNPILAKATLATLEDGAIRILTNTADIGLPPEESYIVQGAIIVPLRVRNDNVGTLKFYYHSARKIDETQQAMAEGLGELLSTQLSSAELDAQTELATRMELKALQAQINPHFLFNTINTIASLIRTDPDRARELLREFAVFYRRTLENSEDLIAIGEELSQTTRYFKFELARFGSDRVQLTTYLEKGLEGLMVPAFIIQPLVENAVNHAIRPEGQLHIEVSVVRSGSDVVVSVVDDGIGIKKEEIPFTLLPGYGTGMGIALKNVDDRLKGYFGTASGIKIESEYGVGTSVKLVLQDAR
ncbi:MAG: histidine kinase [Actinobacteria bacterium]|nr:histidine kinase [Actinomycetota bacterium]